MKLLVFYTVNAYDEIEECHYFDDRYILVNAPEDLLQSEFKSYVYKNYYDKLFNLEKNCVGSKILFDITINSVFYISELN